MVVTEDPLITRPSPDRAQGYAKLGFWPDEPLVRRLAHWARTSPERVALVDGGGRATYRVLATEVAAAATGLVRQGVERGDRVAIQLPNRRPFLVLQLALEAIGAVAVPIPPIYRAHELAFILELTCTKLIAIPPSFRGFDHVAMVGKLREAAPDLRALVVREASDPAAREPWCIDYAELLQSEPRLDVLEGGDARALLEIVFTSGSTGEPKGAMHTSNSIAADCLAITAMCGLGREDVVLIATTLGHQLGFALGIRLPLLLGAKVVLMDGWNADAAVTLIAQEGVTFTCTTPTFIVDVLGSATLNDTPVPTLRCWALAGAVVGQSLLDQARARLPHLSIAQVFGMTEVGAVIVNPPSRPPEKAQMTGLAPAGVELAVLDFDGKEVPAGHDGELVIRCPGLFSGYYGRRALTESSFTPQGFFRSGDQVRIDADGFVQVTGRIKDLIKRGGESVSPPELEEILVRHPKIASVAVVGFPDPRLGERVCACVVLATAETVELEELVAWVAAAGVAKQKWPERIEIVSSMPLTSIGKVHKAELRALVAQRMARPAAPEGAGE